MLATSRIVQRKAPSLLRTLASSAHHGREVVIVSFARTPIGSFNGVLSSLTAPQLGSVAIRAAVERAGLKPTDVQEAYMGNVYSAGLGQAPARQSVLGAGLPHTVPSTTVNKMCASGMKSIMTAAQNIAMGHTDVMVAGGFESMSNVPYLLTSARFGMRYGNGVVDDGLLKDGLWDGANDRHTGHCAEETALKYGFSRQDQDAFAAETYRRAQAAIKEGRFADEIVPVKVAGRKGEVEVTVDEEVGKVDFDRIPTLKPAFKKDGTVTPANASALNDGAAAVVLMSAEEAKRRGITPLARIRSFADASRDPVWFTVAPADAVPIALRRAGVEAKDVQYHEINEAFSVVVLANMKLLGLDHSRVNVNGGAVAMGHPVGCSGARIVGSLISVLKQKDATLGCASICNGGGGAAAMVLERLA